MSTKRQPKGIPVGGEFAANEHDEATTDLSVTAETADQLRDRYATDAVDTEIVIDAWVESGLLQKTGGYRDRPVEYETGDMLIGRTEDGDRMYVSLRAQPPGERTYGSMDDPNVQVSPWRFSMSGMTIEKGRREMSGGGQNYDELDRIVDSPDSKLTPDEAKELRGLWERNHLNDMNAGTVRQKEIVDAMTPEQKGNALTHYDNVVAHLKSEGAYEDKGYRYGTQWLARSATADDFDRALSLLNKGERRI